MCFVSWGVKLFTVEMHCVSRPCLSLFSHLQEAKGEVLVSLSYLPTSEKLSVIILQVNNVAPPETIANSGKYVTTLLWIRSDLFPSLWLLGAVLGSSRVANFQGGSL